MGAALAICWAAQIPLMRERPGGQDAASLRRSARTSRTCDVEASAADNEPALAEKIGFGTELVANTKHAGLAAEAAALICVIAITADRLLASSREQVRIECRLRVRGHKHVCVPPGDSLTHGSTGQNRLLDRR